MPVSTSTPLQTSTSQRENFNINFTTLISGFTQITKPRLLKISNKTQQVHSAKGKKLQKEPASLLSAELSQSRPEAAC